MRARTLRRGFTLVELLVVIAILGVLASLILAAVMKTRTGQQNKTTIEHVRKMESTFARQRTAVLDAARTGIVPPVVQALAANDPDRAKTLWAYIKYRRAFPNSFAEAKSAIILTDPTTGTPIALPELGAPQIYKNLPGGTTPSQPNIEAAACAYLFLTSKAERGEVMDMTEGAGSLVVDWDVNFNNAAFKVKVFKDTFNNPITFTRMMSATTAPELNLPPYAKPGVPYLDPFDPLGRLTKNSPTNPLWSPSLSTQQNIDLTKLAYTAATGLPAPAANRNPFATANWSTALTADNWTGTFVSAGLDNQYGTADDVIGYQVRQGN
jgi:prepilin-type N-terminal cleavage/methylation domain-containing protein